MARNPLSSIDDRNLSERFKTLTSARGSVFAPCLRGGDWLKWCVNVNVMGQLHTLNNHLGARVAHGTGPNIHSAFSIFGFPVRSKPGRT